MPAQRMAALQYFLHNPRFAPEIATLLLDTWMMASLEISMNVLDKLGGGGGDVARELIEKVGWNRRDTAFNL